MTFEEFKEEVKENIKDYLPIDYQDAKVEINDVIKNNDTHLSGLTIRKEDTGIAPTIYLEDFYNQVESGQHSVEGIMLRIADVYEGAMNNDISKDAKGIVNQITDYDATKDKIVPRIVNKESNEERLQGLPHTEMGDLAVTYHVDLGTSEDGQMSVAINNEMMEKYGVSVEELHDQACANMETMTPTQFKSMADTLMEIMVPDYAEMSEERREEVKAEMGVAGPGEDAMYVISNSSKTFGAAALLDSDTMDQIEEKIGEFYILPSSVHECILVPKTQDMDLATLENMVQEVNATQVAPNEVLSDHVYAYDSETKEIYRADREEEHNLQKEAAKEAAKEEKAEKSEEKKERPSVRAKLAEKKIEAKEINKEHKNKEKAMDQELNKKKGAR